MKRCLSAFSPTLGFLILAICPAAVGQVVSQGAYPVPDACQLINAAMQALPPTGGVVDARALLGNSGVQNCASNPFIVPAFAGQITTIVNSTVNGGGSPGWTAAQTGGALYCTATGSPVFLGIIKTVNGLTQLTLTANALSTSCAGANNYFISAKSGVLLLGNAIYQTSVPWIVPAQWRVYGTGRGTNVGASSSSNTVIQANPATFIPISGTITTGTGNAMTLSSSINQNVAGYLFQQLLTGSATISGTTATGTLIPTGPQLVNGTLLAQPGGTGPYQFVGTVQSVNAGGTMITLNSNNASVTCSPSACPFQIIGPDQGIVRSNSGTSLTLNQTNQVNITTQQQFTLTPPLVEIGVSANVGPGRLPIAQGASLQGLMVNCNNVAGGLGVQTLLGQEQSFLSSVSIQNCLGAGFDIEGDQAQNFGPATDLDIEPGALATAQTVCVIYTLVPRWRGVHGMTCTGNGAAVGAIQVGIDESSQAVTLENIHFEALTQASVMSIAPTGIEIAAQGTAGGQASPGQGITLTNIDGCCGVTKLVDINNNTSGTVNQAISVNATNLVLLSGTTTLLDNIVAATGGSGSTTLSDVAIAKYVLGAANPSTTTRTRITSSPNAVSVYTGALGVTNSSGTVVIQPQAGTASYNFNLPTTGAGVTGNVLTSGSGGTSPMTWGPVNLAGGSSYVTGSLPAANVANIPINQVVSATGAIATIADGNFPLSINCALTSTAACLTTGETTAATASGAVEDQITTQTTSTSIPLQITQGAAGPSGSAAPAVFNISVAAAGGAASSLTSAGNTGAPISFLTGAGSAGGGTSGNGGSGGALGVTTGNGATVSGSTNNGGNGGAVNITTGNGASGGSSGAAGSGGNVVVTLGMAGTTGSTVGSAGTFQITGTSPVSQSGNGLSAGTTLTVNGVAGGPTSSTLGSTAGAGSAVSI